jgi:hypothetical protein
MSFGRNPLYKASLELLKKARSTLRFGDGLRMPRWEGDRKTAFEIGFKQFKVSKK